MGVGDAGDESFLGMGWIMDMDGCYGRDGSTKSRTDRLMDGRKDGMDRWALYGAMGCGWMACYGVYGMGSKAVVPWGGTR